MKKKYSILLLALIFAGCASQGPTIIRNPEYQKVSFPEKTFTILPIKENVINILNKDDVVDDFPMDKRVPALVIRDSLFHVINLAGDKLIENVKFNKLKNAGLKVTSQDDSLNYIDIEKRIGKDSILYRFSIPNKSFLTKNNINTDFGLILTNLVFSRNNKSGGVSTTVPGTTISTPGGSFTTPGHTVSSGSAPYLSLQYEFIVYDYSSNKIVTYGTSATSETIIFALTRSNWDSVFKNMIAKIIANTPFYSFYNMNKL